MNLGDISYTYLDLKSLDKRYIYSFETRFDLLYCLNIEKNRYWRCVYNRRKNLQARTLQKDLMKRIHFKNDTE